MAGNSSRGDQRERDAERTQVLVVDLLHREGRPAQRLANQRTVMRALGVAAGVIGVCGVIVAGTVLLSGQNDPQTQNTSRAQNFFTGGRALQPNLIGETANITPEGVGEQVDQAPSAEPTASTDRPAPHPSGGSGGTAGAPAPGSGPQPQAPQPQLAPQPQHLAQPQPQPQPQPLQLPVEDRPSTQPTSTQPVSSSSRPSSTPQPSEPTTTSTTAVLSAPAQDLIIAFFRTAPTSPAVAYQMLAPQMRANGIEEFRKAWKGVRSATVVRTAPMGANTARVVVDYDWADGRRVRMVQRIVVTEGSAPRIADATVLSARNR